MDGPVNIHYAKTHLSRLIERVEKGERIVIARAGRPVAHLVPYHPQRIRMGLWEGREDIWISEDFNDPDPEIEKLFYGE